LQKAAVLGGFRQKSADAKNENAAFRFGLRKADLSPAMRDRDDKFRWKIADDEIAVNVTGSKAAALRSSPRRSGQAG
jgi:hypothetical protein